jgi:transposase-like protein
VPGQAWTEPSPHVASRAMLTERAGAEICRRVSENADAVTEVARDYGVGWHTAMAAVREHSHGKVDDPARLDDVTAWARTKASSDRKPRTTRRWATTNDAVVKGVATAHPSRRGDRPITSLTGALPPNALLERCSLTMTTWMSARPPARPYGASKEPCGQQTRRSVNAKLRRSPVGPQIKGNITKPQVDHL